MSRVIVHNGEIHDEPHYEEYEPIPQENDQSPEEPVQRFEEPVLDDTPPATEEPPTDTPKITQAEAMRQALAELGLGAKNAPLADYLRSKFGIVPKNLAVLKSVAKKALFKKQPEPVEATVQPGVLPFSPVAEPGPQQEENEAGIQPDTPVLVPEAVQPVRVQPSAERQISDPQVANHPVEFQPTTPVNEAVQPPPVQQVADEPKQVGVVETSPITTTDARPQSGGFRVVLIRPFEPKQAEVPPASVKPPKQVEVPPALMLRPTANEPIFTIEEVQAVKDLCDRLGADTFLELMNILGY